MCLKYVSCQSDADDILQEGFLKIYKNIGQFKGEGSFEGWMKRIIINTALREYKKSKKNNSHVQFDDIQEIDLVENQDEYKEKEDINKNTIDYDNVDYSLVEKADFSSAEMQSVIDLLKDDFKIVFHLYFSENLKHAEIAEIIGINEKTSRSRLLRARKFVQKELYKLSIEKLSI